MTTTEFDICQRAVQTIGKIMLVTFFLATLIVGFMTFGHFVFDISLTTTMAMWSLLNMTIIGGVVLIFIEIALTSVRLLMPRKLLRKRKEQLYEN